MQGTAAHKAVLSEFGHRVGDRDLFQRKAARKYRIFNSSDRTRDSDRGDIRSFKESPLADSFGIVGYDSLAAACLKAERIPFLVVKTGVDRRKIRIILANSDRGQLVTVGKSQIS